MWSKSAGNTQRLELEQLDRPECPTKVRLRGRKQALGAIGSSLGCRLRVSKWSVQPWDWPEAESSGLGPLCSPS